MRLHHILLPLILLSPAGACSTETGEHATSDSTAVRLDLQRTRRATIDQIGSDSALRAVRITTVFPEPDGASIPLLFADTGRQVSAGLAIVHGSADPPQLLWPDSVTRVWWSGAHELSFTTATGEGAYVIVNVHQASVDSLAVDVPVPPPLQTPSDTVRLGMGQRYVDSVHNQLAPAASAGELRYVVTHWVPDSTGGLGAFYAVARDTLGREVNPAWYIADTSSGSVVQVDQLVGPATEMPATAGAWTGDGRFIYGRGAELHEVSIRRTDRD